MSHVPAFMLLHFFNYAAGLDLQALIRAIAVSFAVGLLVGGLSFFVTRAREEWKRWRGALLMIVAGLAILAGLITYYAWPSLVNVPSLDGLSQAQAEDLLRQYELVPQAVPQYSESANEGRVIAQSQRPSAGLPVRSGAVVSFAVGVRGEISPTPTPTQTSMLVSLFKPKSGETILATRHPDGLYRVSVQGTSSGVLTDRYGLLLWLKPVKPAADRAGWFLQRPPDNGIKSIDADGTWTGIAQLGNAQYPPHEGDIFDLAVTIVDKKEIDKLMAQTGVVVIGEPVGIKNAKASDIVVTLK